MTALLAALPILLVCAALALGVSAGRAAGLGLAVTVAVAAVAFPVAPGPLAAHLMGWTPTLVAVLVIVAGGLALARIIEASGAQAAMARAVGARVASPVAAALLVVHGVVPFAESVTGFGVGVMVGVPLLRHLGLDRSRAALLGLMGLVAVPWGALAPGTLIAARLIGVDLTDLGVATARVNLVPCLVTGVAAVLVAGGRRPLAVLAGAASGVLLWAAVLGANLLAGTPLAGVLGSLLVVAVHLFASSVRRGGAVAPAGAVDDPGPDAPGMPGSGRALVPYGVLVAGLLASDLLVRATGPTPWSGVASSPATWLVLTCVVAALVIPVPPEARREVAGRVWRMWLAVGVPTGAFLLLGVLMADTGMSAELARAAAGLGPAYLALSPVVGAAGGFVTGSNAGANSMFAAAQGHAAAALGADPVRIVATQNAAAALLTMASPSRVEMAAQFADEPGGSLDRRRLMGRALLVAGLAVVGLCVTVVA